MRYRPKLPPAHVGGADWRAGKGGNLLAHNPAERKRGRGREGARTRGLSNRERRSVAAKGKGGRHPRPQMPCKLARETEREGGRGDEAGTRVGVL